MQAKDEAGKSFDDYWKPSVTLLGDKDLINRLKSYDKDNIPPKCATHSCCSFEAAHSMHVLSPCHCAEQSGLQPSTAHQALGSAQCCVCALNGVLVLTLQDHCCRALRVPDGCDLHTRECQARQPGC